MIQLGIIETAIYFLIWTFGVTFSLYNLYLVGNGFNHSQHSVYDYDDFSPGWFSRFIDTSDFEWKCWTKLTLQLLPWLLINRAGGEFLKKHHPEMLSMWYAAVSLLAIASVLSPSASGIFLIICLTFYGIIYLKQPICIWLLGFLWRRYVPSEILGETDVQVYLIEVASSWLVLRCFAYSLETLGGSLLPSLPVLLGYGLYLPTMFCGPFLPFPSFFQHLIAPHRPWTPTRELAIFCSIARCCFWYFFTVVALHYVYVNAILLRPYMVAGMTPWQLAGLGIAMGHFFHLKYIVFYGLPSCWAAAEGYPTPQPPCCVSRVYLYSAMWRKFDPGLYSFLVRYIYVPVLKTVLCPKLVTRTIASVACFFFVFVWHGEEEYVLYWVLLNFGAVTAEALAREIARTPTVKRKLAQTMSPANQRRLHCLLAAPLHYFSMLSNFFFIGNLEIGKIFFNRALRESGVNTFYILFCLYGAAQTSVTIELWEGK